MSATYNIPANLNLSGGELQEVKLQSLNTTPSNATESRIWYDSVNHKPMYHNGTGAKDFGKEYSEFTGADGTNAGTAGLVKAPAATDNTKFLKGDGTWGTPDNTTYTFSTGLTENSGTVTVTDYDKLIKNVATGNSAIAINGASSYQLGLAIMGNAAASYSIAIGSSSKTESSYAIAIGYSADAKGITIGKSAATGNSSAIAIGSSAEATASNAIQIGTGTNPTTASLAVGFGSSYNYQLLDGTTGKIPSARIPDLSGTYLAATLKGANNGVAELDSSGKVPTTQLPSYVDDIVETYIVSGATEYSSGWLSLTNGGTALTPETGKLYVVVQSGSYLNREFRWGGTTYAEINKAPGQATESAAGIAEIATQTEVSTGTDDTRIVTPKKLATYVSPIKVLSYYNPAITVSGGVATWTISTGLVDIYSIYVRNNSTGEQIFCPTTVTGTSSSKTLTIEMLASANIAASTYKATIIGTDVVIVEDD